MLRWAFIAFAIALIAGIFGYGGTAAGAASLGRVLFFGFLLVAIVALVSGLLGGRAIRKRT